MANRLEELNFQHCFCFYGGEALIHPQILEILQIADKTFNKKNPNNIIIKTNGLGIIQSSPEVMKQVSEMGALFELATYPIVDWKVAFNKANKYDCLIKACNYVENFFIDLKIKTKYRELDNMYYANHRSSFPIIGENGNIYDCPTKKLVYENVLNPETRIAEIPYTEEHKKHYEIYSKVLLKNNIYNPEITDFEQLKDEIETDTELNMCCYCQKYDCSTLKWQVDDNPKLENYFKGI